MFTRRQFVATAPAALAPAALAAANEAKPDAAQQPPVIERDAGGSINFYTTDKGRRSRALTITPEGSLIAGGVSTSETQPTNIPPVIDPLRYDNDHGNNRRNWIHDFYFGRDETPGEGQPRLHLRGLIMWGRGDSPDIQLGRAGPDNTKTAYGPPEDTEPGTCLGKMIFTAWGMGQMQGDIAGMYARNDTVPTNEKNPGSLHLGTAGPSKKNNAWRDMIDRLAIRSNGYVGIGDEFTAPQERLHVDGNVLAEGDLVARGAKKFDIAHPAKAGHRLTHATLEGPEAAVFYRGEAQLKDGRAAIELPAYFEALTRREGRTVLLTNLDGFDRLAIERHSDGAQVREGRFTVICDRRHSSQAFSWEVKAVRADVPPINVEH